MKADNKLRDIPVLVISNLGQEEDVKIALELGAVDYYVKANIPIYQMVDLVKKYAR